MKTDIVHVVQYLSHGKAWQDAGEFDTAEEALEIMNAYLDSAPVVDEDGSEVLAVRGLIRA